jgi:hypothetical protein
MKEKKIFNFKLAQHLVNKGHKIIRTDKGTRGDDCYVFEANERLIKDFETRVYSMRDLRV